MLYLVEKVDFCHRVGGFSRVFDQQGYEPDEGIQVVVTLGSDDGCTGCWVVLLLSLCPIADLHTHFCAQPEESCDQVISLQNTLLVHLREKRRRLKHREQGSFCNLDRRIFVYLANKGRESLGAVPACSG